jgi:hypothetical protein
MRDDILDTLHQFGLPRPFTVTTDNASAAVALANELVGPARSVGCAAHMLQLSVKLAIEVAVVVPLSTALQVADDAIVEMRNLASLFRKSAVLMLLLARVQNMHKFKLLVFIMVLNPVGFADNLLGCCDKMGFNMALPVSHACFAKRDLPCSTDQ